MICLANRFFDYIYKSVNYNSHRSCCWPSSIDCNNCANGFILVVLIFILNFLYLSWMLIIFFWDLFNQRFIIVDLWAIFYFHLQLMIVFWIFLRFITWLNYINFDLLFIFPTLIFWFFRSLNIYHTFLLILITWFAANFIMMTSTFFLNSLSFKFTLLFMIFCVNSKLVIIFYFALSILNYPLGGS